MPLDQANVDDYYYNDKALPAPAAKEMTFLEHLEELRWHIIRSVLAIIAIGIVLFLAKDFVFHSVLFGPRNADFLSYRAMCGISRAVGLGDAICFVPVEFSLETMDLGEQFLSHIKVSMVMGFVVAFPYVFWEIWRFVAPGLYDKERKAVRGIVWICSGLFLMGVLFGYYILAPFSINFLAGYNIQGVVTAPRLNSYLDYMIMFTMPTGLVFELPIVVYFLSKVGLITPEFMKQYRRHAIIIILSVAAIITPPDVFTQFLVAVPLYMLYEVSIVVSARVIAADAAREAQEASQTSA